MFPRPFATTTSAIHPVPGPTEVTLRAPAKVNLSLRVLAKRPDGYHDLETLMVAIGLWDTLRFGPLPADRDDGAIRLDVRVISGTRARNDAGCATDSPPHSQSPTISPLAPTTSCGRRRTCCAARRD